MGRQITSLLKSVTTPLIAFVIVIGGLYLWTLGFRAFTTYGYVYLASSPLPKAPPALSLLDQRGRGFYLNELKGRYYLVQFAFLGCSGSCPIEIAAYLKLHDQMVLEKVQSLSLLTLTLNPEEDSIELLNDFWQNYDSPTQWQIASPQEITTKDYWAELNHLGAWVNIDQSGQLRHDTRTFLINPEGLIVQSFASVPDWKVLKSALHPVEP